MTVIIKKANEEDISGILDVFNNISLSNLKEKSNKYLEENGFLVYPLNKEELKSIIKNSNDVLFVAKKGNQVIGYALAYDIKEWKRKKPQWHKRLKLNSRQIINQKTIYFRHIGRLHGYPGIGLKLEEEVYDIAIQKGYTSAIGEIMEKPYKNKASEGFHTAQGYNKIGSIEYPDKTKWGVFEKFLNLPENT